MITLLVTAVLGLLLLFACLLFKTYKSIAPKELKRRARAGDDIAAALYKVVGFGRSLDIALWFFIGLSAAMFFTVLAQHLSAVLSVVIIALVLWVGFLWLPSASGTRFGRQVAKYTARPLHAVIDAVYPVLARLEKLLDRYRPISVHTGLYSKEDLVELLRQQKGQLDNRISKDELIIAQSALQFGDLLVRDIMTPKRVMKTVNASDSVGPALMDELHKSGHSRFPVYEDGKDNFVGVLFMRAVVGAKAGGSVKGLMDKQVYYAHDEDTLLQTLQAFIATHHHLFLVVNSFEEVVGVITLEDVLEKIIGKQIIDEFDQHDSMRAVAAKKAQKEHQENNHPEVKPGDTSPEVVE
jgi:CBS domain containing-hemolysin-like protein